MEPVILKILTTEYHLKRLELEKVMTVVPMKSDFNFLIKSLIEKLKRNKKGEKNGEK